MHGARTLALQHHVGDIGTAARLHVLAQRQQLPEQMARDLMKDSLAIIKAFRQHLRLHYRLDFL